MGAALMDAVARPLLAVLAAEAYSEHCQSLAERLQLPLISVPQLSPACPYDLLLSYDAQGLFLQQTGSRAPGPVRVDFSAGAQAHRRLQGGAELVARACAVERGRRPLVLDATAGLGRDSFVLASRGAQLLMLERNPWVAALLADGLLRAGQSADAELAAIVQRMQLLETDAGAYLQQLPGEQFPDVIFIDPMFPATKKSALVKKEMQAFHQLVGADRDGAELLELALGRARYRVAVKRPSKAAFLGDRSPSYSLNGKAVRFDIYANKAFAK